MTDPNKLIQLATKKFKLNINGHHGIAHWQRVESNGFALAMHTGADVDVVQHFAWLHDACRLDEDADPKHGERAGLWAFKLWTQGRINLTVAQMALLQFAIGMHNHGGTSKDPTVGTCFDADRLDLWRVGVTPAERFLSTHAAKCMLKRTLKDYKELV